MFRLVLAMLIACLIATPASADRIKDLGAFQGIRTNQLTGYGIVVGLAGTGDDNLEYTIQSVKAVASRFGLNLPAGINPGLKNAAVVMITAELPPFAKPGQKIDITVASMGKAKSLRGGALILTPLMGADGQIYAMAQGNLAVGGLGIEGKDGSSVVVNVPSTGRIPEGATVERAVATGFDTAPSLTFNLARADFTTAQNVAARDQRSFRRRRRRGGRRRVDPRQRARRRRYPRDDHVGDRESRRRLRRAARQGDRQRAHRHRRDQFGGPRRPRRGHPRQADRADRREADRRPARTVQQRHRPRTSRSPASRSTKRSARCSCSRPARSSPTSSKR